MTNAHEHEDNATTNATRRGPLAALAAVGVSMVAGPLLTDKAPGLWTPAFLILGTVVLVAAAALFVVDVMQARGITPTGDEGANE